MKKTTSTSVHVNPVAQGYKRTDVLDFTGNDQGIVSVQTALQFKSNFKTLDFLNCQSS
jgi:hypothetical protein